MLTPRALPGDGPSRTLVGMSTETLIRVAVADDSKSVRILVEKIIEAQDQLDLAGSVENGDEVMGMIAQFTPDILLLDINMPGRNGIELLSEIAASFPQMAVLMLTGVSESAVVHECLKLGASGYLLKDNSNWHLTLPDRVAKAWKHKQRKLAAG